MRFLSALITTIALVACHKEPEKTAVQLRAEIHAAAEAAETSVKNLDKEAAEAAAKSATVALDQLRKMHGQRGAATESPVDDALMVECESEVRKVGQWATLTKEKVSRKEKLAGWKAKAYYAVDGAVWKIFIHGFAFAADQAANGNLNGLPLEAQKTAKQAAKFAETYVGPQRLASGEVDWAGVSRALRQVNEMPTDIRLILAFLELTSMEFDAAFFELEAIPEASLKTEELRAFHRLLLGASYLSQGYGQLGMAELEEAEKISNDPKLKLDPAGKCLIHCLVACYFLHERRWSDADRCLAAANRAWPDNPLITYLTGERQIATNQYVAAEESFAKASQGSAFEWVAEKVTARAKRLRDSPANLEPVVFDFNFMAEIVTKSIEDEARKSESVRKLREQMESAKAFMRDLKEKLPEVEMKMKMPEWKMPELKELFQGSGEKEKGGV
jgi:hypothetical protein